MYHTLEHLYSPGVAIRKSYELLRPGGTLLIGVPKFDSWPRHVSKEFWAHLDLPRHLHHFTEPVLVKMIRESGFSVREIKLSSKLVSFFFTVRTLQRGDQLRRLFTMPQGTLSDVMLVVAEKL
jgi:predicted SAM-dependent methyltransferase